MARTATRSAYDEFVHGFEASLVFCHMHSYDLYRRWLEAAWAFLDAGANPKHFRDTLDSYTHEEGQEFGRLLALYGQAVEADRFRDILGEVFMRLDVNSVNAGQFFSPFGIAAMMARMQFSEEHFRRLVQEKGEITVCDPAVGSGVMLMAFAKITYEFFGEWGLAKLRLYGMDIDPRCVLMCRIQLRMNGLDQVGRMAGMLSCRRESGQTPDASVTHELEDAVVLNGDSLAPQAAGQLVLF